VAEWTVSTAYNQTDISFLKVDSKSKCLEFIVKSKDKPDSSSKEDFDRFNDPENLKLIFEKEGYFAAKGGSWCYGIFYLEPSVSFFCKPTEQHSYIGFRPVMNFVRK